MCVMNPARRRSRPGADCSRSCRTIGMCASRARADSTLAWSSAFPTPLKLHHTARVGVLAVDHDQGGLGQGRGSGRYAGQLAKCRVVSQGLSVRLEVARSFSTRRVRTPARGELTRPQCVALKVWDALRPCAGPWEPSRPGHSGSWGVSFWSRLCARRRSAAPKPSGRFA